MTKVFFLTIILFRLDGMGLPSISHRTFNTFQGCEDYKGFLQQSLANRWALDKVDNKWRFSAFCHEDRAVAWPSP